MKIGYARVSSVGQNLDVQKEKLTDYACEKLFAEKESGAKSDRPKLQEALEFVREGDQFVVTKLDRLGRSLSDLVLITNTLQARNVDFVVLDQQIDTSSPTGKLLFHMLSAIGEFERELIKERQTEGIENARARGVKFGRRHKLSQDDIEKLKQEFSEGSNTSRQELAEKWGIGKSTLYRLVGI
jgi:DNA invertase Pin-like site-specific DNA recombinase